MIRYLVLLAVSLPLASAAADKPRYLCIAEQGAGLIWDESTEQWEGRGGDMSSKYLVKPSPGTEFIDRPYEVSEFGQDSSAIFCKRNPAAVEEQGPDAHQAIACDGMGGEFRLNLETMRFQYYYRHGYLSGEDTGDDTPHLVIGRCSKL